MNEPEASPVLDARLLLSAVAVWGSSAVGISYGATTAWVLAVACAVPAAILSYVVVRRTSAGWSRIMLAALLFGAGCSVVSGWRAFEAESHPLTRAGLEGAWVSVEVEPTEDPHVVAGAAGQGQVFFRATAILWLHITTGTPVAAWSPSGHPVRRGSKLFQGRASRFAAGRVSLGVAIPRSP
ncbi:hypothetical protein O4214_20030 [Rhodococcus erythropolis]|uniref:hypothetical protein n=1 Tax=Rhodococcus erythropolis TaxID=1833 RepID=UPI001E3926D2|nr:MULTISPECIES: hypothetical protein [Rhodococcus erythropolis group]MCD2105058.1 hypothetical protein [Rhodococcus qingshengii]MCZ4526281.1 hypothetical protein [Rhodococcus erythropolis]